MFSLLLFSSSSFSTLTKSTWTKPSPQPTPSSVSQPAVTATAFPRRDGNGSVSTWRQARARHSTSPQASAVKFKYVAFGRPVTPRACARAPPPHIAAAVRPLELAVYLLEPSITPLYISLSHPTRRSRLVWLAPFSCCGGGWWF